MFRGPIGQGRRAVCALCVTVAAVLVTAGAASAAQPLKTTGVSDGVWNAVSQSFLSAKHHHGRAIVQMRAVTAQRKHFVIVYSRTQTSAKSARVPSAEAAGSGTQYVDFFEKATKGWRWSSEVPPTVADSAKDPRLIPTFEIQFLASGSDTITASSDGDLADNPYCHYDPTTESDRSDFKITMDNANVDYDATNYGGFTDVGWLRGSTGSAQLNYLGGCVGLPDQPPSQPRTESCAATFASSVDPFTALGHLPVFRLSARVDRRGRHALVIGGPAGERRPDNPCPGGENIPIAWTFSDQGPLHHAAFAIPDADIASHIAHHPTPIKLDISSTVHPQCASVMVTTDSRCSETLTWKGTILIDVRPSVSDPRFEIEWGPEPQGSSGPPQHGSGSRG